MRYMFPDNPIFRNFRTREVTVTHTIQEKLSEMTWILDSTAEGGCSGKRPDALCDLGYRIIIVEIDENQHRGYSCENKRTMEISKDLGHRPVVFIRFNPDGHWNGTERVQSCWTTDKRGIMVLKKDRIEDWSKKMLHLIERIQYWADESTQIEKMIEQEYLYYDVMPDDQSA